MTAIDDILGDPWENLRRAEAAYARAESDLITARERCLMAGREAAEKRAGRCNEYELPDCSVSPETIAMLKAWRLERERLAREKP